MTGRKLPKPENLLLIRSVVGVVGCNRAGGIIADQLTAETTMAFQTIMVFWR